MTSNPLIGTWRLLSWENRSVEDGLVSYPLGKDATGYAEMIDPCVALGRAALEDGAL